MELDVELGELVFVDNASFVEIAQRTLVDNVADGESLDGLILRRLAAAAVAHDKVGVVATVPVTAVVAALHSHREVSECIGKRRGGQGDHG